MRLIFVAVCANLVLGNVQSLFLFPFLVSAVVINYDPIVFNNATMVKQLYFMFDNVTAPASRYTFVVISTGSSPGDGDNYIELQFEIKKDNQALPAKGVVEVDSF